jgi:hypothetical protein
VSAKIAFCLAVLATLLLANGPAVAQSDDHYSKNQLRTACDYAGGTYSNHSGGSYFCSFDNGSYIACNRKHNCANGDDPSDKPAGTGADGLVD